MLLTAKPNICNGELRNLTSVKLLTAKPNICNGAGVRFQPVLGFSLGPLQMLGFAVKLFQPLFET